MGLASFPSVTGNLALPFAHVSKDKAWLATGGPLQFRKRLVMLEIEPKYIQNNSRRHPSMRLVVTHKIFAACWPALFLSLLLLGMQVPRAMAQANVQGQWSTLPNLAPINPIHAALLPNGKVLIVAGSGNCPPSQSGCPAGAPYGPSDGSGSGSGAALFKSGYGLFHSNLASMG